MKAFITQSKLQILTGALLFFLFTGCVNVNRGTYPPFIKAALEGNISETDSLLREGEFVGQTTIGNQTALHVAAAEGQNEMVKWLLAREANPLAQDQNGKTPADFARSQGHVDTEKIILEYIQVVQDEEIAFANGDIEKFRELLASDYRQYTVLHVFAQNGDVEGVKAEIEAGADVNARTAPEVTPLHKATITDQLGTATLLIENGADVNAVDVWNNPPIYYAVLKDNPDMVRLFIDAGARIDFRSAFDAETVLEYAERKGNVEIIQMMKNQ